MSNSSEGSILLSSEDSILSSIVSNELKQNIGETVEGYAINNVNFIFNPAVDIIENYLDSKGEDTEDAKEEDIKEEERKEESKDADNICDVKDSSGLFEEIYEDELNDIESKDDKKKRKVIENLSIVLTSIVAMIGGMAIESSF